MVVVPPPVSHAMIGMRQAAKTFDIGAAARGVRRRVDHVPAEASFAAPQRTENVEHFIISGDSRICLKLPLRLLESLRRHNRLIGADASDPFHAGIASPVPVELSGGAIVDGVSDVFFVRQNLMD